MDKERKKRLQTIRLIITEIIMVIAVIITVIILTFIAMGYNVDKNGELNQSGLVQIKSIPSGATVQIDGEQLLLHTNTSRMLDAGTHHIKLEKEGYSSWEKDIISESGVLLKLDYPRLFLDIRTPETIRELSNTFEFFSVSSDRNYILYSEKHIDKAQSKIDDMITPRSNWTLLNVKGDDITETKYDFSEILGHREIVDLIWNSNNDHVLLKTKNHDSDEWLLINLKTPQNSSNLTLEFGLSFSDMLFASASGERLIGIENGNLRNLSAADHSVSEILAKNVRTIAYSEPFLAYITTDNNFYFFQDSSEDVLLKSFSTDHSIKILISSYLDRKYISFIDNNRLYIYKHERFPNHDSDALKTMELVLETDLSFNPSNYYLWSDNELFVATDHEKTAIFDAELDRLSEFTVEGNSSYFLDEYILGTIKDNTLIVRDFDGTNRIELTSATGYSFISKNNRYLYYQKDNAIVREKILE